MTLLTGGAPEAGLVSALGAPSAARVHEILLARARAWARDAFGSAAVRELGLAPDPAGWRAALRDPAAEETAEDPGEGATPGWTFVIAPELAEWSPELAVAAFEDLRHGCALTIGPMFNGGAYLIGIDNAVLGTREAITGADLAGRDAMRAVLTLAADHDWEVGLLRAERALRRAADIQALRADPLTDTEIRQVLE